MSDKQQRDERFVQALGDHRAQMYRVALAMLRSPQEAEDAVSQATLKAYAGLHRLRSWDSVRPWLMRITVNAAHQTLRRRKRETVYPAEALPEPPTSAQETPLWMYLDTLPHDMRVILTLRYGENLPIDEIAHMLRIPRGTVSARLTRAKRKLAEQLGKEP
ncbi:MAG: RNA polymerase sigma factor [Clostridiales bacterium]|nr:RNA polymerase sigma factor [Clostridiales bacterium]